MNQAIEESKIVDYEPIFRNYGILYSTKRIKMLKFCPWCGVKLPTSLQKVIFDVIKKEFGIPRWDADLENCTNIPQEFKTDEWWKKRGL